MGDMRWRKEGNGSNCLKSVLIIAHNHVFSVPLDEKVPEGAEPRFWEEEGFYVGKPPQVSPANLNIMENRIKDGNQVFIRTRYILWPNLKEGHLYCNCYTLCHFIHILYKGFCMTNLNSQISRA